MKTYWTDPYIGIPFVEGGRDFSGCDCGGLMLLVLRMEKGIIASDFNAYSSADFRMRGGGYARLSAGVEDLMKEWVAVDRPQPFDLVRYRYGRYPVHVGIWTGFSGQEVLHVEEAGQFARLIAFDDLHWRRNFIEFRRYKDLMEAQHERSS